MREDTQKRGEGEGREDERDSRILKMRERERARLCLGLRFECVWVKHCSMRMHYPLQNKNVT